MYIHQVGLVGNSTFNELLYQQPAYADIVAIGRTRIITAGESWDSWFEGNGVTSDFMSTREKPDEQIREDFR
ncbi:hypothetical protein WCU76_11135 [Pectobacterium versatile]